MPDGSVECGMILQQLENLQQSISRLESKIKELDEKIGELASYRDRIIGAAQALSLVGGAITIAFGLIGWIAVEGIPSWLKQAFR